MDERNDSNVSDIRESDSLCSVNDECLSDKASDQDSLMITKKPQKSGRWLWSFILYVVLGFSIYDASFRMNYLAWAISVFLFFVYFSVWLEKIMPGRYTRIDDVPLSSTFSVFILCYLWAYLTVACAIFVMPGRTVVREYRVQSVEKQAPRFNALKWYRIYALKVYSYRRRGYTVWNFNPAVTSLSQGDYVNLFVRYNFLGSYIKKVQGGLAEDSIPLWHFYLQFLWHHYRSSAAR